MEQLRQILSQLALNLELNIAMCDKIEEHEKRLGNVEALVEAHRTQMKTLRNSVSEYRYVVESAISDIRKASKNV